MINPAPLDSIIMADKLFLYKKHRGNNKQFKVVVISTLEFYAVEQCLNQLDLIVDKASNELLARTLYPDYFVLFTVMY